MDSDRIPRRSHTRRTPTGRFAQMRSTRVAPNTARLKRQTLSACPHCGAKIVTLRMPNGGRGRGFSQHMGFDGDARLQRTPHHRFEIGRGLRLGRARDASTWDLFDPGRPQADSGIRDEATPREDGDVKPRDGTL